MIELKNLTKKFDKTVVVDNLNFNIKQGEVFAFLGPNGAGKTTTIKMLTGLIKPSSGSAFIGGLDVVRKSVEVKKLIGYLPDQPFVYPKLKGIEYLRFITEMFEINYKDAQTEIEKLAGLLDMQKYLGGMIESYSQGMKQKLVLMGVFFRKPKVIFMDEPMVGLDPKSARVLKHLVREYADSGSSFFISTHTLEIAEKLSDRIGIIKNGRIILLEDTFELLKRKVENKDLEDIFLELTGGAELEALIKSL